MPRTFFTLCLLALISLSACSQRPTEALPPPQQAPENYLGSAACQGCHVDAYASWSQTWMARTVRDPIPQDLARIENTILCAGLQADQVLGGKLALRYLQHREDGYVFLPCEWDAIEAKVKPFRPHDWPNFSFDKQCASCHTTGYVAETDKWNEMGVGCETCHGPGERHGDFTAAGGMVRFAEISPVQEGMICSACHLQGGYSLKSARRFPEGYTPGMDLFSIYRYPWEELETQAHALEAGAGEAGNNPVDVHQKILMKMQLDKTSALRCTDCHSVHAGSAEKHATLPRQDFCMQCHIVRDDKFELKDYQVTCPICEF
jgi:predicted CXXCH cytochrome family protein